MVKSGLEKLHILIYLYERKCYFCYWICDFVQNSSLKWIRRKWLPHRGIWKILFLAHIIFRLKIVILDIDSILRVKTMVSVELVDIFLRFDFSHNRRNGFWPRLACTVLLINYLTSNSGLAPSKGQLISELIYEVIVSPIIRTKNCQDFCPHYTGQKSWQFSFVFWEKRWLYKFIRKLSDL